MSDTATAEAPTPTKEQGPQIDLATLSPEAIASLQKQLQERNKAVSEHRGERNTIMTQMLAEKSEDGEFVNTTRDIAFKLASEGLCALLTKENFEQDAMKPEVEKELRKVQAKKQQLEKATDEKGKLVAAEGTYGYKTSARAGSGLVGKAVKPATVVSFFTSGRASELTKEDKSTIVKAIKAS